MEKPKPIHTLVLDTGPLIKNDPAVSSLIASAQVLVTHPSVITEIRDAATRSRLETTLQPFLSLREPKPESVKFIQEFAKKSGDLQSLSRPDILLLALTYEIECERNGGDWRLRKVPGQKGLNGSPPEKEDKPEQSDDLAAQAESLAEETPLGTTNSIAGNDADNVSSATEQPVVESEIGPGKMVWGKLQPEMKIEPLQQALEDTHISRDTHPRETQLEESETSPSKETEPKYTHVQESRPQEEHNPEISTLPTQSGEQPPDSDASESDSDSWITPSNLSKHQARDSSAPVSTTASKTQTLQSALLTTDYAMQNVALLLNLNLLSSSLVRITNLRTTVQRCHACFFVIRPSAATNAKPKQFCPRCGLPTLTRVSCSTSAATGAFAIHLKKNMQWSNRGSRYSVPKPTAGTSSGLRVNGGGKGGWGNELLLAEDQKEYVRAVKDEERRNRKERDLMDDEFLGGLLGGGKGGGGRAGGRVKVGAGRDVNSKKRK